jgi:iron-sulfur cluster assembly protein
MRELVAGKGAGAAGLRLGIRSTGCSGLTYELDFAREIEAGAEVVEADGVKLVIDPKAVIHLLGTEVDFVEDRLGAQFVFNNPNEKARCGCGESFSV